MIPGHLTGSAGRVWEASLSGFASTLTDGNNDFFLAGTTEPCKSDYAGGYYLPTRSDKKHNLVLEHQTISLLVRPLVEKRFSTANQRSCVGLLSGDGGRLEKAAFRVLVVDDYERWQRFICSKLQTDTRLQVIGEASDGLEGVQIAQQLQPDLILMDIGLPTLNGIEASRQVLQSAPKTRILFVSEQRSADIVEKALRTGATGYVLKSDAANELLPAVEAVLHGQQFVSTSLSQRVFVTTDDLESNPYLGFRDRASVSAFLAKVIKATGADFGNVQLFDSTNRVLRIVAQHGFEKEFLDYFNTVEVNQACVCGRAMNERSRMVVTDIATDPLFSTNSRAVLLRANVRSVQSTPLIDSSGKFVGMVSTHYCHPRGPMPNVLEHVDNLAADFLAKNK